MKISYEYEYGDKVYFVVADRVFRGYINRVGDDSCLCKTNFILSKTLHREVVVMYTWELPDIMRPLASGSGSSLYFEVRHENIFPTKSEALQKAQLNLATAAKVNVEAKELLKYALTNFVPSDTIDGKSFREKCKKIGVK